MWERSFVAVSVLISSPRASIEETTAALPEGAEHRVADLVATLRDPRRAVRAQGLATGAQEVAFAIGEITLR